MFRQSVILGTSLHFDRGKILVKAGRLKEAIADFSRAFDMDRKLIEARRERGLAYKLLGDHAAAKVDLTLFLGLEPGDQEVIRALQELQTSDAPPKVSTLPSGPPPDAVKSQGNQSGLFAETLDAQQKAIELIESAADRICNVVSTKGEAKSSEAKGNVTAQLSGLASKLADVGVSGTGSINSDAYQSVLRQDLAATLKDNAACKLKVFDALQSKLLGPALAPAPLPAQQTNDKTRSLQ